MVLFVQLSKVKTFLVQEIRFNKKNYQQIRTRSVIESDVSDLQINTSFKENRCITQFRLELPGRQICNVNGLIIELHVIRKLLINSIIIHRKTLVLKVTIFFLLVFLLSFNFKMCTSARRRAQNFYNY